MYYIGLYSLSWEDTKEICGKYSRSDMPGAVLDTVSTKSDVKSVRFLTVADKT